MEIPKIIHQIWSSKQTPYPKIFDLLADTWKKYNPDWQYILWDDEMMDEFMEKHYPQYKVKFDNFLYDIQRWDIIRYLILYKMGGLYVDCDYECLENIEPLLKKNCCFSCQTEDHIFADSRVKSVYFDNAFMGATIEHPFMAHIIDHVFQLDLTFLPEGESKLRHVLETSGAVMISNLYHDYAQKDSVYLIPAKYISPFSVLEARAIRQGVEKEEWEIRLDEAYAVHHFMASWGYN